VISFQTLTWIGAIAAAMGVGSSVWLLLDRLYSLLHRWRAMRSGQRWASVLAHWQTEEVADSVLPASILYDINPETVKRVRLWSFIVAGAIGIALILNGQLLWGFTTAGGGVLAPGMWLNAKRRRQAWQILQQVRDFVTMLNLAVGMSGSLVWALRDVSEQDDRLLNRRLRHHLERNSQPLLVLARLAEDMRSPHLKELTRRLQAAEHGAGNRQEAVAVAVEAIATDINETAAEAIEETPMRLMFPMLVAFLPTVLVIVLYPMVVRILAVLSGDAF